MQAPKKRIDCSHIISLYQQNQEKGNLYLSSVGFLNQGEEIKSRKINSILSILDNWAWHKFSVKEKVQNLGVAVHHRIELQDDQDSTIYPHLQATCEFIKSNLLKTNVLVHCQAGVSRSSSFVIAFLMKEKQMGFNQAKKYSRERRKCVSPNGAFEKELREWEQILKKNAPVEKQ